MDTQVLDKWSESRLNTSTIQVLTQTRYLLTQGWRKNYYASTHWGTYVNSSSPKARKWCALGALSRVVAASEKSRHAEVIAYKRALGALRLHLPETCRTVTQFNDRPETKKQDVLGLFDRAIYEDEKWHH